MEPTAAGTIVDRRSMVSLMSRLRASRGQADPYPIYAELRSMGDVLPAPWGGHLLLSHELCDQVLRSRTWATFDAEWRARQGEGNRWSAPASRQLSKTLQGLNPPHHTRQRRSLGNVFDRNTLTGLQPFVAQAVEDLLDRLSGQLRTNGEADFSALVGEDLPVATIGHWLKLPQADHALLRELTHGQAYAQELLPSASQLAQANAAAEGLREYFTAVVAERRRSLGDDALSNWIRTWDELEPDREVADETLYHLVMFIVIASLETTSTLLSNMVWLLDQHPRQRAWLLDHPEAAPNAVEEVLRYDPPIHLTTRVATEDTVLSGVRIARDEVVHVMIAAANHDPDQFVDPDTFDIGRTAAHLGFGGGIHYCIGAALARVEATELLQGLIRRFPTLRVTTPPLWEPRMAFRRLTALHVAER
ncbi:cytochrome P450 [Streptomyces sp. NPDC021354]|uniref:Cytochrome P450 n=2 Tax=Streptomyces TaxID=1883 RepID=A0ABU2XSA2_9ACTN|nr:cytochrome P450 [Streptomyces sp. DSM 41529]MDT0548791.1 cytochrome P450 [Streptomyces sp. DSM 41529]